MDDSHNAGYKQDCNKAMSGLFEERARDRGWQCSAQSALEDGCSSESI